MIDFRYHLVSIVAVFLALAIGIVLGTTTLRGPVMQRVQHVADTLRGENDRLRGQVTSLRQQVEADQQLVSNVGPGAVEGSLEGERVAVVEAPGASDELRLKLKGLMEQAGATVTRHVSVQPKYLSDGDRGVIGQLAARLKPSNLKLPDGSAYERAGTVLASALMTDGSDTADTRNRTQSQTALSGFATGGYITTGKGPGKPATLAVMVAPAAPLEGKDAASDNAALVALAGALDQRGTGALMAGTTAATRDGGLIRALRGSNAARQVSTVDFAGTATGRVAAVLALAQEGPRQGPQDGQGQQAQQGGQGRQRKQGEAGHYGIGPGAQAYLPPLSALSSVSSPSRVPSGSAGQ